MLHNTQELGIDLAALQHETIGDPSMIIRDLFIPEEPMVSAFMLTLSPEDRYRRFCRPMSDAAIAQYVAQINWNDTALLGAFDASARLIGLLELCDAGKAAEIAVAVASNHRERGVARALMTRAVLKAAVLGKERVVLTCLTENIPMRRLARSVGLHATSTASETEAELALEQPGLSDVMREATYELIGNVTYAAALCTRSYGEMMQRVLPRSLKASAVDRT